MTQISLTFPDGNTRIYPSGITPSEIAVSISNSLGKKAISAHVDGRHWDLQWPILEDCTLKINTMKDEDAANELIRHDLAHIMARAVQELWPETKVTIGPVIENGWYYDFDREESFVPEDLELIQSKMKEIINLRDEVKTEIWDREKAIEYYKGNNEHFKLELIDAIPEGEPVRMYWHGHWRDMCRGPHLQHTGQVPADAFRLRSIAGAFWRGDPNRPMLQRIYGNAFTSRKKLREHINFLEEAEKRDHRRLGREMDLFHMQPEAPGQIFWHPAGWTIFTTLQEYIRRRQKLGGYVEISTPQVVARKLWEASGHWEKFRENMFIVEVDEEHTSEKAVNALKPMNCPGHVQIFNQGLKSYRDLPLRMAEFGSCNRYEPSGALHGIMRVRGFVQDDGHIFCREDQIESETAKFIQFLSQVYHDLGFREFKVKFSDRPDVRAGEDNVWDKAEKALLSATHAAGMEPELNPGEGAFYGPKLEFVLTDAIGRDWQCGTHQVDFVLPERLDASYIGEDGAKHRPVMLHRATLGSFERFIGILVEEHAGNLPMWLAPWQVVVASIVSEANEYAEMVASVLTQANIRAKSDIRNEKIGYKVREHSLKKTPVILACGVREVADRTVTIRRLGEKSTRVESLDDAVSQLAVETTPPDMLRQSGGR
ncbi:MAG: threonine--tRNA ligase [Roseovarius sp.]|nr:threonine--tRNA ligase [Roseovarius sp.]